MKTLEKKTLFWDTETPNPHKNKQFILERILNFGDIEDYLWALKQYGTKEIKIALVENKTLDDKSLNFWCDFFNIEKERCINNRLSKKQSRFWKK